MKKTSRLLAAVIILCMLTALPAFASSEEPGASAEPAAQPFSETITYNDTTYGYGPLELVVTGEASPDGTITIADVTWYGESVIYYMTDSIRAELEEILTEAGVVPAGAVVTEPFSETITYNDTTYGYGPLELVVTGEASSDGTISIADVTWYGESVIYYMTDSIRAELEEILTEAGVVPAASGEPSGEPSGDPQGFAQTISYNDTTYGYGLVDLTCAGVVNPDGSMEIYSVSWYGEEVSGMMTPEIEAELAALLAAAGVAYGA